MAKIKGIAQQSITVAPVGEGDPKLLSSTRLGQLFTADWRQKLLLAGKCFRVTTGSFGPDADITEITGGGAGTILQVEQPEVAIGVGLGYYLIPLEIRVSVHSDQDADVDYVRIVAMLDRTQSVPTSVTGTTETPVNMLDGGPAFPGTAYSAITVDIEGTNNTDPIYSELLAFKTSTALVVSGGSIMSTHDMLYEPDVPSIAAGPCGIYVYWGGTVAVAGLATVVFACVPAGWVEY